MNASTLKKLCPFQSFSDTMASDLLKSSVLVKFPSHCDILSSSDVQDSFFIVKNGILKLSSNRDRGQLFTIDYLKKHDCFSDIHQCYSHNNISLSCLSEVELISLPLNKVLSLCQKNSDTMQDFVRFLSNQYSFLYTLLFSQVFHTNTGKLVHVLFRLASRFGKDHGMYTLINRPFTHRELARFVGTSREAITKSISWLKQHSLISYLNKKIVILDQANLSKIVA